MCAGDHGDGKARPLVCAVRSMRVWARLRVESDPRARASPKEKRSVLGSVLRNAPQPDFVNSKGVRKVGIDWDRSARAARGLRAPTVILRSMKSICAHRRLIASPGRIPVSRRVGISVRKVKRSTFLEKIEQFSLLVVR